MSARCAREGKKPRRDFAGKLLFLLLRGRWLGKHYERGKNN